MALDTPYDIQRLTGVCLATQQKLKPGDPYVAVLLDPPLNQMPADAQKNLGFVRRDISQHAWDTENYRPQYLFSYWRAEVPIPNKKQRVFVDDTILMQLLRDLQDVQQSARIAFRYVLALVLMRKHLLRFERIEHQLLANGLSQEWWHFTPKLDPAKGRMSKWNESDTFAVLDPHIQPEEIPDIATYLGDILDGEWEES